MIMGKVRPTYGAEYEILKPKNILFVLENGYNVLNSFYEIICCYS